MEEGIYYTIVKEKISTNSTTMIVDVKTKADGIIKLSHDKKPNNAIVNHLKNIIIIINDNRKKLDTLINEMMN